MNTPKTRSLLPFLVAFLLTTSTDYAQRPFQLSFLPGWGTNGPLNARETNKLSINLVGGSAASVVNHTHFLKGIQLGVINIADTSRGVSIGLINIIHHRMHELAVYADEWSPLNVAFRSGSPKLYSILFVGLNPDHARRSYYYGYGLGHQFPFTPSLSLRPELSVLQLSPVSWLKAAPSPGSAGA